MKVSVPSDGTQDEAQGQGELQVCHLAQAAYQATEVPVHLQKLIFKGKQ